MPRIDRRALLAALAAAPLAAAPLARAQDFGRRRRPDGPIPIQGPCASPAGAALPRPSTAVHVSPQGDDGGDGSATRPLRTIQAAVQRIGPGVAVLVHAGTYAEAVKMPSKRGGAPGAPFQILSADGPGAAKITPPDPKSTAIKGLGVSHVVVADFAIEGGDNGVQFSQAGADFSAVCADIEVRGCRISGVRQDGIKISQADDVRIVGNQIAGCGQQCVDFVAVWGGRIVDNDCAGAGVAAAIFAKGGSKDILIAGNHVHDVSGKNTAGIEVGGWTGPQFIRPGSPDAEASHVVVRGNRVERIAQGAALSFLGGADSEATDNYLQTDYMAVVGMGVGSPNGKMTLSRNNDVHGNVLVGHTDFLFDRQRQDPGRDGLKVRDNRREGGADAWPKRVGGGCPPGRASPQTPRASR